MMKMMMMVQKRSPWWWHKIINNKGFVIWCAVAFSERSHRKFTIIWITCLTICSLRAGFCGCFFPLTVITCSASASSCGSLSCFLKEQCWPTYCQIHATLSSPARLEIRQDNALLSCQRNWISKYTIKYKIRMSRFVLINSVLLNLLEQFGGYSKTALYKTIYSCRITWDRCESAPERRIVLCKSDQQQPPLLFMCLGLVLER